MTKQRNRPGVGVYFALILLLLCGYYLFFDMTRVPGVSYAQVEDLFRREQVQSFYVKDGSELYLSLRDGATVRNELGSTDRFREDLGELIREQKAAGILVDYDFAPVYRPPWWSGLPGHGLGQQGLAGARRAYQQHALGDPGPQVQVPLGFLECGPSRQPGPGGDIGRPHQKQAPGGRRGPESSGPVYVWIHRGGSGEPYSVWSSSPGPLPARRWSCPPPVPGG